MTALGVLVVFGVILVLSLIHSASVRSFDSRQRRAVGAFSDRLVATIPSDVQSAGGDTVFLFPDVSTQLDDLANGTTKPADSLKLAQAYSKEAAKAVAAMQAIRMSSLIPADLTVSGGSQRARGLTRVALAQAQFLMLQGLHGYQRAFTLWQKASAPDTPDALRKALAGQAQTLAADAEASFDKGWTLFVQLRHQAGLAALPQFSKPTPTTPPVTTPPPTPSPTSSATASPSSSPSGSPSSSPTASP
jgi:hypothetical protein